MKILVSNPRFIEWESFVEEPWNLHLLKYFPDDFDAHSNLKTTGLEEREGMYVPAFRSLWFNWEKNTNNLQGIVN